MEVGEDQWFIVTDKLDQQGLSPELCRKRWESIKNMADLEAEKNARVQKERDILELLSEEANKVETAINLEKEGRLEQG